MAERGEAVLALDGAVTQATEARAAAVVETAAPADRSMGLAVTVARVAIAWEITALERVATAAVVADPEPAVTAEQAETDRMTPTSQVGRVAKAATEVVPGGTVAAAVPAAMARVKARAAPAATVVRVAEGERFCLDRPAEPVALGVRAVPADSLPCLPVRAATAAKEAMAALVRPEVVLADRAVPAAPPGHRAAFLQPPALRATAARVAMAMAEVEVAPAVRVVRPYLTRSVSRFFRVATAETVATALVVHRAAQAAPAVRAPTHPACPPALPGTPARRKWVDSWIQSGHGS
jgi:hypothetical protein